jgi:hypothetical protein
MILATSCGQGQPKSENNKPTTSEENVNDESTVGETSSSQEVKELYPIFGREFNDKVAAAYQKVMDTWAALEYDFDKFSEEIQQLIKEYNISIPSSYYTSIAYGGCDGCSPWHSYYNTGPYSITASSHLKSNNDNTSYVPENAHDGNLGTAWVEGVKGYGIGEYLVYSFEHTMARITEVKVANGYVKTDKTWRENSRVKKLKMYVDDKPFAILNLEDSSNEQIFKVEPIGYKRPDDVESDDWYFSGKYAQLPAWTLKFEILEVYKGDKYDDTAISQIYFDGIID